LKQCHHPFEQCQTHTASYLTLIQIAAAQSFANFFHYFGKMAGPANKDGRTRGVKNYKNEILINIIAGILPNGLYGWDQVAAAYMTSAKEEILRDTDDLKRHWVKTLCNGMKS
jgi:hypothetical protein